MDTSEFNATFWLSCVGLITAFISGSLIYFIKSKCIQCDLCYGLISIKRDVKAEIEIEQEQLEHGINPNTIDNGQQHN
jgi:hypothetical protein